MEENPHLRESPHLILQQHSNDEQTLIMEQTLHMLDTSKRPINLTHKISHFIIKVALSKTFDPKQFKIISSLPPKEWIHSQKLLFTQINSNKKLHERYFPLFLANHTTIAHWYQLAIREKGDIEPYVFTQMFNQRRHQSLIQQNFNNEKVKQSLLNKKKWTDHDKNQSPFHALGFLVKPSHDPKPQSFISDKESASASDNNFESENASFMKPTFLPLGLKKLKAKNREKEPNYQDLLKQAPATESPSTSFIKQKQQVMGVFFNNMIELNEQQNKRKPLNLKLYKRKKKEEIDSHDLYMKTFDACNGRKYIFYDYEKHMKGLKEKNKYNFCLRNGAMQATMQNYLNEQNHPSTPHSDHKSISNYQQFQDFKQQQQIKQKCSLLPINLVLNERQLNNYKGMKKVVCNNKSRKVVFVNHQGKPITYYIKQEHKPYYTVENSCKNTMRANPSTNFGLRKSECNDETKIPMVLENARTLR